MTIDTDASEDGSEAGDDGSDADGGEERPPVVHELSDAPGVPVMPVASRSSARTERNARCRSPEREPMATPLGTRPRAAGTVLQPRRRASSAKESKAISEELTSLTAGAGLEELDCMLAKAELVTVDDLEGLTASELRLELERRSRGSRPRRTMEK